MKTMNLRDANQQFSKLVREIEETGEPVLVLRNGKPAIRLSAVASSRGTAAERETAKQRLMEPGRPFAFPEDWKFNRDEIYEDAPTFRQVREEEVDAKLLRTIEETGETVEILRDGQPMVELRPSPKRGAVRKLTVEQEVALKSLFEIAHRVKGKSRGRKLTRDEMHER